MDIAVLGIDLGKNSCSVVGLDAKGRVVLRRRMHRESVVNLTSVMTPCVMAMEAVVRTISAAYCGNRDTKCD